MSEHSISDFEFARGIRANFNDFAGDVGAKGAGGIFVDEEAEVLHFPVHWIDGPCLVPNEEFTGARFNDGCGFDSELGAHGREKGCAGGCHP